MSREDVFKMMTQEQHDDYTRELEDKIEAREIFQLWCESLKGN